MEAFYPSNGYKPKIPFWHVYQCNAFERSCDLPKFALFHSPRVGKSKVIVDTCCYQFKKPPTSPLYIRGMIVVVWPAGGHYTWTRDAFPENATIPWKGLAWDSNKATQRQFQIAFRELCEYKGFAVFAINIEALISERCREHIGRFAAARKLIMATGDEISAIANSDTRRARIMMNLGTLPFVKMWRILDGTPVDKKGPLDFYSEFGFMGHDILGYPNEIEFQAHYAEIETKGRKIFWGEVKRLEGIARDKGYKDPRGWAERMAKSGVLATDPDTQRKRRIVPGDFWTDIKRDEFDKPMFKNMDELHEKIDPISDRCTFKQAFPNWKEPVFAKRYFELTPEQRRVYNEVVREYRSLLHDGTEIAATHHLVRVLRQQQITSNYYPDQTSISLHESCEGMGCELCNDSGVIETEVPLKLIDPNCNPRMDALREELKEGRPSIIWVRFCEDGNQAMKAAEEAGMNPVPYYGPMNGAAKLASWEAFQVKRTAGAIVANWSRGARAIRLDVAEKHVAASNQWSFRTRQQGEQRSEHGAKTFATSFIDIVGIDTVDDQLIIPALRTGLDVSTMVMRDAKRPWI